VRGCHIVGETPADTYLLPSSLGQGIGAKVMALTTYCPEDVSLSGGEGHPTSDSKIRIYS
jgi:hypothetical protein